MLAKQIENGRFENRVKEEIIVNNNNFEAQKSSIGQKYW